MYIQLRIVGIRMEVDTLSVDFVSKVANVQINNRGPSTDPCGTEQQRHMCVMYYRRTRREMFYPTGMRGDHSSTLSRKPNWCSSISNNIGSDEYRYCLTMTINRPMLHPVRLSLTQATAAFLITNLTHFSHYERVYFKDKP